MGTARAKASEMDCKADSTLRSSQAVPHPSTNRALRRLTSEVGRDPVYSTWYGRRRQMAAMLLSRANLQERGGWCSDLHHFFVAKGAPDGIGETIERLMLCQAGLHNLVQIFNR